MALKYARDGHAYYSVDTPSVFREFELPDDESKFTVKQTRQHLQLEMLAKMHATHIEKQPYQRG